jgi:pyruvate dehydrogenase E2 component (dihydrolipoamide acetyltransferase)
MSQINMPKLSDSMVEATILTWLKQDGDQVQAGEDLVEIETDKATMTYQADASGILRIVAAEGTTLRVGAPIARLAEPTDAPVTTDGSSPRTSETKLRAPDVELIAAAPVAGNGGPAGMSFKATPLARRVAQAHGVALEEVRGSGPLGRITRTDVLANAGLPPTPSPLPAPSSPSPASAPPSAMSSALPAVGPEDVTVQEPTRLQQVIARRMAEAKATIPEFEVQTEVIMDEAIALRGELKALAGGDPIPSFNDIIIKACAVALRRHPRVNASYRDGHFELHRRVNVGFAVATTDALLVPILADADTKSLGAIARETRHLAERVRSGEVTPPELSGGTFTVSNLGMFGMTAIRPVINPPQAAILGVGAMRSVLARVDAEIVDRTLMTLTLSSDHRILYGSDAALFLAEVRDLLEAPLRIAL